MRNREYRALLTFALMISLVAGSVKSSPSYVYAKENVAVTAEASAQEDASGTSDSKEDTASSEKNTGSAGARKDETVFAKVNGNGQVTSVTVSDQLKNISSKKQIQDVSGLKEIENVKGDETFKQLGDNLVWSGDSRDICYQGTTDKELPVGINISYKLDGKDISEDDLQGKSGHLTIHYGYDNKTAGDNEEYTPFLMVTGLMINTEKFTNVTIDNGKIISDGDKDIVIGMGIPKMKEALGVEDLDIPDSFTVEADVTDYETIEAVTVATNDLFNQIDTDQFDSLDELKGSMEELQSASSQLVSGSGELKNGLDTLLSSSGTLIDGISRLSNGSSTLKNGTGMLVSGTNSLKNGAKQVADGASSAAASTTQQLLPGVQLLDAGVAGMQQQLSGSLPVLANGVSSLNAGVQKAAGVAASLDAGVDQAAAGAAALQSGIQSAAGKAGELQGAAQYVAQYLNGSQDGTTVSTDVTVEADNSTAIGMLQSLMAEDTEHAKAIQGVISQLSAASVQTKTVEVSVPAKQQDAAAVEYANIVSEGLGGISCALSDSGDIGAGIQNLYGTLASTDGNTVKAASAGLNGAFNTSAQDSLSLKDGMASLENSVNGEDGLAAQLNSGVSKLKTGTSTLLNGEDGKGGVTALAEGMNTLSDGAGSVAAGASEVSSGANELNSGAGTLSSGIGSLKSGSGALLDGVQKLDGGASDLSEGMIQFDEEGIKKLVRAFDGDIDGMLDKLNGMLNASKEYKNFTGISEGMDGEVKFVFVTEK